MYAITSSKQLPSEQRAKRCKQQQQQNLPHAFIYLSSASLFYGKRKNAISSRFACRVQFFLLMYCIYARNTCSRTHTHTPCATVRVKQCASAVRLVFKHTQNRTKMIIMISNTASAIQLALLRRLCLLCFISSTQFFFLLSAAVCCDTTGERERESGRARPHHTL